MLSLQAHEEKVRCLAYLPDSRRLLSGGKDGRVILWDVFHASPLDQARYKGQQVTAVAVSPDGRLVAVGVGKTVRLLLLENNQLGRRVWYLLEPTAPVTGLQFAADGSFLAASTGYMVNNYYNGGATVWFLDAETPAVLDTATLHSGHRGAYSLAVSPDSGTVAVGRYKAILLWNPVRGENRQACRQQSRSQQFELNDTLRLLSTDSHTAGICYSPDQSLLAAAQGYRVVSYATGTLRRPQTVCKHKSRIVGVDFIAGGEKMVCVTESSGVVIRETATGEPLKHYTWEAGKLHDGKAAPDGSTCAVAGEGKIIVWDLE